MTPAEVAAFLAGAGRPALGRFLARQRWFAARGRPPGAVDVVDWAPLGEGASYLLALVAADGERYYVPVAASTAAAAPEVDGNARIATAEGVVLYDAHIEAEFGRLLLAGMATSTTLAAARGRFECGTPGPWPGPGLDECKAIAVQPLGAEQSNTSVRFARRFIMKSIRRPTAGPNPEFEITHFLATRTSFTQTPGLAGWIDHVDERGARSTVAILQPWIEHEGDGWAWALMSLGALAEALGREPHPALPEGPEARMRELAGDFTAAIRELGATTGSLHLALASDRADPDFAPEPIASAEAFAWAAAVEADVGRTAQLVEACRGAWPPHAELPLAAFVEAAPGLAGRAGALHLLAETGVHRIRTHGDYHLGQVLRTHGGFAVVDFEGEPARPLAERRAKHAALRDVAGMLRSFSYAAHSALRQRPADERPALAPWFDAWERLVGEAFRRGYLAVVGGSPARLAPPGDQQVRAVTGVFELEKALYEIRYELAHRPDWVDIPLVGLARLASAG